MLRYFFGEVASLYCQTQQVNPAIKGEDVATTLLKMKNGVVCIQEISFSSPLEREVFPQTLALIEGSGGSIRLDPDLELCVTVGNRTTREKIALERYSWQSERRITSYNVCYTKLLRFRCDDRTEGQCKASS